MSIWPFSKTQPKEPVKPTDKANEIIVGLDVGTRYIKTVLFQCTSNDEIKVIGYARTAQKFGAMRDAMIVNLQNVIEACDLSIGRALAFAEKRYGELDLPSKCIIGIAGELVKGVAIVANYERDTPNRKITAAELSKVVEHVKKQSFSGAINQIAAEVGLKPEQVEEISTKIDTTQIDGHLIDNPLGFTGQHVAYRVYSTFAPKIHVNALYELANHLGFEEISIYVQPYAIARAIKEKRMHNQGAIIIDVGGGTTDIALVNHGGILGTKMFAFGGDTITKRIAEVMKLDIPAAEELKIAYSEGETAAGDTRTIKSIINQDLQIWAEGVQIALEELLDDENGDLNKLPGQIYICGGGVALTEVRDILLAHPWLTVLPFEKFPNISYLYPNNLIGIEDDTKLLIDPSDVTPASIARMYIDQD